MIGFKLMPLEIHAQHTLNELFGPMGVYCPTDDPSVRNSLVRLLDTPVVMLAIR
jgi:hypothetical protein